MKYKQHKFKGLNWAFEAIDELEAVDNNLRMLDGAVTGIIIKDENGVETYLDKDTAKHFKPMIKDFLEKKKKELNDAITKADMKITE